MGNIVSIIGRRAIQVVNLFRNGVSIIFTSVQKGVNKYRIIFAEEFWIKRVAGYDETDVKVTVETVGNTDFLEESVNLTIIVPIQFQNTDPKPEGVVLPIGYNGEESYTIPTEILTISY